MSMKIAIAQFFLIAIVFSICENPSQPQGQCTECGPLDILINGTCYIKIRGCLRHLAGPICQQCQFGYVLSKQTCIREAIFFNNTNITFIPPVKITPNPTLTYEDIKNKLGDQYGIYFSDAHEYFLTRYSELGKGNIKSVDRLQTKKGVFLVIEYQGDSLNRYQAVAFVNSPNSVKEWSFGIANGTKKDPFTANASIYKVIGTQLKDFFLYEFQHQGNIYIFNYMNAKNQIIRVTLNKNDVQAIIPISKLDVKNLTLTDLFVEELIKIFPQYKNNKVTAIQKIDEYYVANLGPSITVSFTFNNYRFIINKPIQAVANVYSQSNGNDTYLGSFGPFNTYSDPRFIACVEYAAKEFPELIGAEVAKVQIQLVAGTNFLINLKKTPPNSNVADEYEFRMYFNLQDIPIIFEAKKNGKFIYNMNHNYNLDSAFLSNYRAAQNATKIVNIPGIDSVLFKLSGTRRYYKVTFSPRQFMEFEYIPQTNKVNALSYYVDGEDLITSLSSAQRQAERRNPDILFNFLVSKQPALAKGRVQEIVESLPSYIVTVVTSNGTYKGVIEDKGGDMVLNQFVKVSDVTCYDLSVSQIQNSQRIKMIDDFLKLNYPLTGFNIQLIQTSVRPLSYIHRYLYANPKLKQLQLYLQQIDGNANVIKASYVNFGYEIVDATANNQDYQKITSIMKNSDLAGSKVPFFTEVNGSVIKAYYDDGKSTSEIYYDKILDKASAQVIATRPYLLVPDGFGLDTLVYPSAPSAAINATLTKITQEALKKYSIVFRDAVLIFADKKNNSYTLMYKNTYGYQKLDAFADDIGNVVLNKLVITGYRDSDFSNCVKFSTTGKCLSCNADTQVQYQGYCHKKLEGCLIQPGSICVKCNINYVKANNKCSRACTPFFN